MQLLAMEGTLKNIITAYQLSFFFLIVMVQIKITKEQYKNTITLTPHHPT